MRIDLSRPVEWEGVAYDHLDLDFERFTGSDLQAIERDLRKSGVRDILAPETDSRYLVALAARAARVDVELLAALPARDYTRVKMEAQGFLLGSDSEPSPDAS